MSYYILNDNVYIVGGSAKGCIYDFNNSRLFSVNKALLDKLIKINSEGMVADSVDGEFLNTLDNLMKNKIVIMSDKFRETNINELKKNNSKCNFAWIEITEKCNLRCKHCYNESGKKCEKKMEEEEFYNVIDILKENGISKIQITGGEPFMNKNRLKKMLDYAVSKFSYIEIFTNGTLISDDWFEYLKKNNIHLALSVYSYNHQMHDKVTGVKGSFEKTNRTIEKLKMNDIPYRVCNVLMRGIEVGEKNNDFYTLSMDRDVVRLTGRANINLLSSELIKKRLITIDTFRKPIKKEFCSRLISGHNCFNNKIYISSDLNVFPCVMERRMKHCSLKSKKLILNDKICKLTKDNINKCSECEYRYACFDCRPNSISKEIYEKPWYCTYNPLKGEWLDENEFIEKINLEFGKI